MSQIIAAAIIQLLVVGLPMIGLRLGNDQITSFAQTLIVIGTAVWIWFRRYQQGDVKLSGLRK